MAIAFAHVSIHSRAKGHSAVAAAAYRAGALLYDERLGKAYNYSHRTDVQYNELLLPEGAIAKFLNREFLWNEAERVERRKDAQVSKDFVLALPKELDLVHQIELAKRFAQVHFIDNGLPADISIHDHGDGNPHAHILVTTRRLIIDKFHTHKARDLNPEFGPGYVKEEEFWNDKWRDFQTNYFIENEIDLSVDLDHIIPERHHGGHRNKGNHYIHEENEIIKLARQEIVLKDIENFINILSIEHSVFTKRDIEILLFKTIDQENYQEFFQVTVEKVLSNKNVICLGENEQGHQAFTTRHQFKQESKLLQELESLAKRKGHLYRANSDKFLKKAALSQEQKQAFDFIVNGGDISCIIGRPGVGKSYMLKPIKDFYQKQGCRVLGLALSGKVAKQLQTESDMESSTIASFGAKIYSGQFQLKEQDILVIDEAGMVDFANMSFLIEQVKKAKAKIILVGDPDQLSPIKKGAIFKGIANHLGCFTMVDIKRQKDLKDRQASIDFAKGDIQKGLEHYYQKGAITIADNKTFQSATRLLIDSWNIAIKNHEDISENIIIAHANSTVHHLNLAAREVLIKKGLLDSRQFNYAREIKGDNLTHSVGEYVVITHTDNELGLIGGEQARIVEVAEDNTITLKTNDDRLLEVPLHLRRYIQRTGLAELNLSKNERIVFKKGDTTIGIKNGDIGIILCINESSFIVGLDSGEKVTVPKTYKQLDYAYAMTVHKSQGLSVNNTFVCIDTQWWDRMLSFVAFTRHKERLQAFANSKTYPTFNSIVEKLSQKPIRDNVIDYPLNLGLRHGFYFESLVGRAVSHLTDSAGIIKNKINYLYNYAKACQLQNGSAIEIRSKAKDIAQYLDLKTKIKKCHSYLKDKSDKLNIEISELDGFDHLFKLSSVRDKKAFNIMKLDEQSLASINLKGFDVEKLKAEAKRYNEFQIIKNIVVASVENLQSNNDLGQKACLIDLDKDVSKIIIKQLAKQKKVEPQVIYEKLEDFQKHYRTRLIKSLVDEYSVLGEYLNKVKQREKIRGYSAEKIDKNLTVLAKRITANKTLNEQIKAYLPKLKDNLNQVIKKGLDKDRGIEL